VQGVEVIVVLIPFAKYPYLADLFEECFAETPEREGAGGCDCLWRSGGRNRSPANLSREFDALV
jgi:hypothetical protein